jgi:putative membrane protein
VRLSILSYDIIKSLHLIAVISWMVGLLYLPRLFVYHNESKHGSDVDNTFLSNGI